MVPGDPTDKPQPASRSACGLLLWLRDGLGVKTDAPV